jgi:hypothetical protein
MTHHKAIYIRITREAFDLRLRYVKKAQTVNISITAWLNLIAQKNEVINPL